MKRSLVSLCPFVGIVELVLWATILLQCCWLGGDANGQSAEPNQEGVERSALVTVNPAGIQRFAPDSWSSLSVVGLNQTNQDSEEVVSVFLAEDPAVQYSKRMWLPANAKRQTWMPFHLSRDVPRNKLQVTLSMIRIDQQQGVEQFAENFNGEPVRDRSVMLAAEEINTALIGNARRDQLGLDAKSDEDDLSSMLYAARDTAVTSPLDLPMVVLGSNFIPRSYNCLDELDQLVVAGDQLLRDTAGLEAVRQWLHRGGRLWIMVDQTDPQLVNELLGDDLDITTIDRVELNDFELEIANPRAGQLKTSEPWSSERPATLVRIVTEVDDVAYRINGWPAAAWKTVGRGEVLITTLESHGWSSDSKAPTTALISLAKRFFEPRNQPLSYGDEITPLLENQIGYQIPSRGVAGMVLGLNVLVVLCLGGWWMLQRTLERMAFLIPCSAVLSAAALFWVGKQQTQSVPSTIATGQVIQAFTGTPRADVTAFHAVFSQGEESQGPVASGAVLVSSRGERSNQSKRIQWSDSGSSETRGERLPPGAVRHYQSSWTKLLAQPMAVRGSFDEKGFVGRLDGIPIASCEDAVAIESFNRASAISFDVADDTWPLRCNAEDLLPENRFASGAFLSEEQRLRQEFVQAVFRKGLGQPFGASPSILVWTKPFESGATMPDTFESRGSALAAIPIVFDTPPVGIDFRVPATFISLGVAKTARGASTVYNPRTGKWMEDITKSKQADLLFSFPEALNEMSLRQVNVTLKINAPSRNVIIKCMREGVPTTVHEAMSPTGVVQFTLDGDELLGSLRDDGWWMQIGVAEPGNLSLSGAAELEVIDKPVTGDAGNAKSVPDVTEYAQNANDMSPITWTIESLHIDAVGRIEASPQSNPAGQL